MTYEEVYSALMTKVIKVRLVSAIRNLSVGIRKKETLPISLHAKLMNTMANTYIVRYSLIYILDEIEDIYPIDPDTPVDWITSNTDTVPVFFYKFLEAEKASTGGIYGK